MSDVREIDVQTGEETTRPYTQAELDAIAAYAPPPAPTPPTREQLLAELAALTAKIQALPE